MSVLEKDVTAAYFYLYGVNRGKTMLVNGRYQFVKGVFIVAIPHRDDIEHKKVYNAMRKYNKVVLSYDDPLNFEIPDDPDLVVKLDPVKQAELDSAKQREAIELKERKEKEDRLRALNEDAAREKSLAAQAAAKAEENAKKLEAAKKIAAAEKEKEMLAKAKADAAKG